RSGDAVRSRQRTYSEAISSRSGTSSRGSEGYRIDMTNIVLSSVWIALLLCSGAQAQSVTPANGATVLHAAHLLDVETGRMLSPGEVLVQGQRIVEAGASVTHPP